LFEYALPEKSNAPRPAPEARPKVAHGETVGWSPERRKPRTGRKNKYNFMAIFSAAPAGAWIFLIFKSHGWHRGLLSFAAPQLDPFLISILQICRACGAVFADRSGIFLYGFAALRLCVKKFPREFSFA
jgi:hypothetical protein